MRTALSDRIAQLQGRLKPAKDRFAINAYRFASQELEREKAAGLPILDLISSQLSHNYRILLLSMSPDRREAALNDALIWRHRDALALLGEKVPAARPSYLEVLFDLCLQPPDAEAAEHGYLRPWDMPKTKLNKAALWKALKPEMARITGDSGEPISGGERWYRTHFGQWTVTTYLDAGGKGGGIRLSHDIWTDRHLDLRRQISILNLLGFPFRAEWTQPGAGEEERVATCAAMVCERLIGFLSQLLEGVIHNISPDELKQYEAELAEEGRQRRERRKQLGFPSRPRGINDE